MGMEIVFERTYIVQILDCRQEFNRAEVGES